MPDDLPVMSFADGDALRDWLALNHRSSSGLWVRIFRSRSGVPSATFEDVLEQGLCFGWSESTRTRGDGGSYLQRFTPRRRVGTTSERNRKLAQRLLAEGRMTTYGLKALGMDQAQEQGRDPRVLASISAGLERILAAELGAGLESRDAAAHAPAAEHVPGRPPPRDAAR